MAYLAIAFGLRWLSAVCDTPLYGSAPSANCLDFWLNRYQTLFTGIIAILVAWLTIRVMQAQSNQAEVSARRVETESEGTLKEIIRRRTGVFSEVWRGIDWALKGDETLKEERSKVAESLLWETIEERIEYENMKLLCEQLAPRSKPKVRLLLLRWEEMLTFLEATRDRDKITEYSKKVAFLRIKLSFIAQALERYDPVMANVFVGCGMPPINPGTTSETMRDVRDALIANFEKRNGKGQE